jgi:hypothetical protein
VPNALGKFVCFLFLILIAFSVFRMYYFVYLNHNQITLNLFGIYLWHPRLYFLTLLQQTFVSISYFLSLKIGRLATISPYLAIWVVFLLLFSYYPINVRFEYWCYFVDAYAISFLYNICYQIFAFFGISLSILFWMAHSYQFYLSYCSIFFEIVLQMFFDSIY